MRGEINYKNCNTIEELRILIDDYMDYYNSTELKKLTPVQYRNQLFNNSIF